MSLEDIVKNLTNSTLQLQQETRSSIQNLSNQITQLAMSFSELEAQNFRKLPLQLEVNPKENVSAIVLRSGKEIPSRLIPLKESEVSKEKEETASSKASHGVKFDPPLPLSSHTPLPHFPSRLAKPKEDEQEKEILDTFRKVEINISLLDAVKQIPKYAKFLKELCTNKRRMKEKEKVVKIERAMLDLGASINVMPFSVYRELKLNDLQKTGIVIQLVDRSYIHPIGVVEDVWCRLISLYFLLTFYILEMDGNSSSKSASILLGRPFMKTTKTKINVDEGTLFVEFDGQIVKFNIFDAMKYSNNVHSLYHNDVIDSIVHDVFAKESIGDEQE
ncbi:uncharacterized protein LOC125370012 [Ricinus communis]|uniref:uncharacterized protein LOC125370012 n=1 Tax=Ricinus communis TaxID=3988 RepID=UPI00201A6A7A|nr:uncharacterized protein LOC125370012 [Ricinus communis]